MNARPIRSFFSLLICVICVSALGQSPPVRPEENVTQEDVVRVNTTLVGVPVTVMDRDGRRVTDLKQTEFHLYEDGVEQEIAFFAPGDAPVTVLVLFDKYVLGKKKPFQQIGDYRETADLFIKQMRPGDKIIVAKSGSGVSDAFEISTEGTPQKAVKKPSWHFSSSIHETVSTAIKKMNKLPGRKAIVFFSDGVYRYTQEVTQIIGGPLISHRNISPPESSSELSNFRELAESDAPIYVLRYDTMSDAMRYDQYQDAAHKALLAIWREEWRLGSQYLSALAQKSGARLYQAGKSRDLEQSFAEIASEISRQYSLGYYPKNLGKDSEARELTVKVDRPGLVIRARSSYLHAPRK
jgi:Ca-activated chloride channel homolog